MLSCRGGVSLSRWGEPVLLLLLLMGSEAGRAGTTRRRRRSTTPCISRQHTGALRLCLSVLLSLLSIFLSMLSTCRALLPSYLVAPLQAVRRQLQLPVHVPTRRARKPPRPSRRVVVSLLTSSATSSQIGRTNTCTNQTPGQPAHISGGMKKSAGDRVRREPPVSLGERRRGS